MTPDDRWIDMARFDAAHADRVWAGSADIDDAPAWYGQVATLIRAAAAPTTEDELAGESEIVARMQAAILEPAPDDEAAGESEIVARMQATILELATYGDADRPRHLRAPDPWAAAERRRRGARVVRRIVAAKAAAVTTVVAIGVTAAAATTGIVATVVVPALLQPRAERLTKSPSPSRPSRAGRRPTTRATPAKVSLTTPAMIRPSPWIPKSPWCACSIWTASWRRWSRPQLPLPVPRAAIRS